MTQTSSQLFSNMPLIAPIQSALKETGYTHPTPIQAQAIPLILNHHDILALAQTGTGKTAAFCLPIIQNLFKTAKKPAPNTPRCLILAPTRELALQISDNLKTYSQFSKLKSAVIYGGVGQSPQVQALNDGIDILVATTGRLLDLVQQKYVKLDKIEVFVLDEADRMLDMGFMPDIHRIIGMIPKQRQTLLFSATMPKEIATLAQRILNEPHRIEISPETKTADRVEQFVAYVDKLNKLDLLIHLLKDNNLFKVIVFVEMKHLADRITDRLNKLGILSASLHSNKSQTARQQALEQFKKDKIRVLVATEIAARGIDVDNVTHVINFDISHVPENYVHRIGRTARAGASGHAISFCTGEEKSFLYAIEKEIGQKITEIKDHPYYSAEAAHAPVMSVGKAKAILEEQRMANKKTHGQRPQSGRAHRAKGPQKKASEGGAKSHGKPKDKAKSKKSFFSKKRR